MAFVPLFCLSHYSSPGVASPADLARRARSLGYNTLGICDEATVAGFQPFDDACQSQGIRPTFGCRLLMRGLVLTGLNFPMDFLVESEQGYRNLIRLLNHYHDFGGHEKRVFESADLHEKISGLVCVIPADGELVSLMKLRDRSKTEDWLDQVIRVYQLQAVLGVSLDVDPATRIMMQKLSRFLKIRGIAAQRIFYPEPGDASAYVFLKNPRTAPTRTYQPDTGIDHAYLKPEDEHFRHWDVRQADFLHGAGEVARRCYWRPNLTRRFFPAVDLERGFDPNSYLFDLVIRGATQVYGEITENIKLRINREFEEIKAKNLASWLLLNLQITRILDERGISRGAGRGRLVSSLIAYCLGISRIDPMAYQLTYKSLISEGETLPPLYVEIPRGGVEVLVGALAETYGDDQLIEIGKIRDVRRDQLINELAEWCGMTEDEQRLARQEKSRLRSAGAAQRLGEMADESRSRRWRDPSFIADMAARLAPRPRMLNSSHDRYALSNEPLEAIVPSIRSAQDRIVSGIGEMALDRMGLARIIFVSHGLLDILDQATRAARMEDPGIQFNQIPLDDRSTFELLGQGNTFGIPPLEGVTVRCLLRKEKPTNLLQVLRIRTMAAPVDSPGKPHELSDQLPDVLLSYQCAYLRANFPIAFFSAAIGGMVEKGENPSLLLRQANKLGIRILTPDINVSEWSMNIHGGAIRLGLAAVRGLGRTAWHHIEAIRSGGRFTSLENFCDRIDNHLINLRLIRTLIASGAMDDLDPDRNRSRMNVLASKLQRKAREQLAPRASEIDQGNLFEMDEMNDILESENREPDDSHKWNPWEMLQHEVEALGFSLSADPIDSRGNILSHLRPRRVHHIRNRMVQDDLYLAGLVGCSENTGPLIEHEGDLMIDIEGLPVYIPAAVVGLSGHTIFPVAEVLVIGNLNLNRGFQCLDALGIWLLSDLEDQASQVSEIQLNFEGLGGENLKRLLEMIKPFPGSTKLRIRNCSVRKNRVWRKLQKSSVYFCSPLYQSLSGIVGPDSIELFGHQNEALEVQAAEVSGDSDRDVRSENDSTP